MVGNLSLFLPISLSLLGTVYIYKRPSELVNQTFSPLVSHTGEENDVGLIHEPENLYFAASYIFKINENILMINSSPWLSALQQNQVS